MQGFEAPLFVPFTIIECRNDRTMVIVKGPETTETYLFHVFYTLKTCAYFWVIC